MGVVVVVESGRNNIHFDFEVTYMLTEVGVVEKYHLMIQTLLHLFISPTSNLGERERE
jgi:hypothetical protein